jgi:hypothetical protein
VCAELSHDVFVPSTRPFNPAHITLSFTIHHITKALSASTLSLRRNFSSRMRTTEKHATHNPTSAEPPRTPASYRLVSLCVCCAPNPRSFPMPAKPCSILFSSRKPLSSNCIYYQYANAVRHSHHLSLHLLHTFTASQYDFPHPSPDIFCYTPLLPVLHPHPLDPPPTEYSYDIPDANCMSLANRIHV